MEHTYYQAQDKVLAYAHAIIDHGFKPGILIIDEGWHNPYGDWTFDRVVVFWDGQSRGTLSVIKYAEKAGKPCEVVLCQ